MVRNNPYFLLSGLLSASIFFLFFSILIYMMLSSEDVKTFALKKDNYISISLDIVPIQTKKVTKKPIVLKKEVLEVINTPEVIKEVDIGNLFSDIWTKDVKVKKENEKVIDNKRFELMQKKIETSKNKPVQKPIQELENIKTNEKDIEDKKSSSGDEVNEYLARIQAIVYKYFEPPANSQGNTVKAIIELSALGKVLDFRIITYSANTALNEECDKINARLLGILFPEHPENKSFKTIVNLTSDK